MLDPPLEGEGEIVIAEEVKMQLGRIWRHPGKRWGAFSIKKGDSHLGCPLSIETSPFPFPPVPFCLSKKIVIDHLVVAALGHEPEFFIPS